jgi:hypothetical protein
MDVPIPGLLSIDPFGRERRSSLSFSLMDWFTLPKADTISFIFFHFLSMGVLDFLARAARSIANSLDGGRGNHPPGGSPQSSASPLARETGRSLHFYLQNQLTEISDFAAQVLQHGRVVARMQTLDSLTAMNALPQSPSPSTLMYVCRVSARVSSALLSDTLNSVVQIGRWKRMKEMMEREGAIGEQRECILA